MRFIYVTWLINNPPLHEIFGLSCGQTDTSPIAIIEFRDDTIAAHLIAFYWSHVLEAPDERQQPRDPQTSFTTDCSMKCFSNKQFLKNYPP